MKERHISVGQLLSAFWLCSESQINGPGTTLQQLKRFADERRFAITDADFEGAANHLEGGVASGDAGAWVTQLCFLGHPHAIWNFLIDAVRMADDDEHLKVIAAGPAEHILAHYGSMIPHFEEQTLRDPKFKRMLTGVWRHRMSDDIWMRLRAIQSEVCDPLSNMIPLEHGVEYMSHSLSQDDREKADKASRYFRDAKGVWQRRQES